MYKKIFVNTQHAPVNLHNLMLILITISLLSGCAEYAKKYDEAVQSAKSAYDSAMGLNGSGKTPADPANNNTGSSNTATNKLGELKFSGSNPVDQSMDNILFKPEQYYDREQFFSELELKKLSVEKVSALDGDFINLYIPTHQGLPRIGVFPNLDEKKSIYGASFKGSDSRELKIKKALAERLTRDTVTYMHLGVVASKEKLMTAERIKVDKSGVADNKKGKRILNAHSRDFFSYKGFMPRLEIEVSTARILSPAAYKKYLCDGKSKCSSRDKIRGAAYNGNTWGGGKASEFESRKKFHAFVDKIVPKVLRWGGKFSRDVYIVNSAQVVKYDFDRKGVIIHLSPSRNFSKSRSSASNKIIQNRIVYKPKDKATDIFSGKLQNIKVFMPMNEAKGESFMKRAKINSNQVYFTLKARFYDYDTQYKMPGNLYEPIEKKLDFYMGSGLKDKFYTALKVETLR